MYVCLKCIGCKNKVSMLYELYAKECAERKHIAICRDCIVDFIISTLDECLVNLEDKEMLRKNIMMVKDFVRTLSNDSDGAVMVEPKV